MSKFEHISKVSPLLDDALRVQLREVLQKLTKDVFLVSFVDEENEKSVELASLLLDMEGLCDRIRVELYEKNEEPKLAEEVSPEGKLPAVGIYDGEHQYTGISFLGVPGGKELNSLVFALYNTAGPGQPIEEKVLNSIQSMEQETTIQVFVSLACHHCAQTVAAAQRMASLNPKISAQMIDANLFPDYVEKYKIERVPVTIINGEQKVMGAKSTEELVKLIRKR